MHSWGKESVCSIFYEQVIDRKDSGYLWLSMVDVGEILTKWLVCVFQNSRISDLREDGSRVSFEC
jgi:hypothetical protein